MLERRFPKERRPTLLETGTNRVTLPQPFLINRMQVLVWCALTRCTVSALPTRYSPTFALSVIVAVRAVHQEPGSLVVSSTRSVRFGPHVSSVARHCQGQHFGFKFGWVEAFECAHQCITVERVSVFVVHLCVCVCVFVCLVSPERAPALSTSFIKHTSSEAGRCAVPFFLLTCEFSNIGRHCSSIANSQPVVVDDGREEGGVRSVARRLPGCP